jgi:FKBP-type peptidyl-prolyl cis-trans isomerase FkpA
MRYGILVFACFALALVSCNSDDDNGGPEAIPPSLLSEVAPEDDETIREFLNTHFYNYEDFDTPPEGFDYKIVIDTIAGENSEKKPLMEDAETFTINVSSSFLGLDAGEEDVPHTYYYIEVKEGGGGSPTYADSTLLRYQGSSLDGIPFDERQDFTWQVLPSYYRGYANGVSNMKAGTSEQVVDNPDGTNEILDSGMAIIVMPSGLAAFNGVVGSAGTYAPVLFKVELGLFVEDTDSDNDGIPSIQEDVNGNGFLGDDNTDIDVESSLTGVLPNYLDADDDGDGISTRNEISDDNGNIITPYPDADGDGVPDYLDPDN